MPPPFSHMCLVSLSQKATCPPARLVVNSDREKWRHHFLFIPPEIEDWDDGKGKAYGI